MSRRSRLYGLGRLCGIFLAALMAALITFYHYGLRLALSDSATSAGVYQFAPLHGTPAHGELVGACLPASIADIALDRGYATVSLWSACPNGAPPVGKLVLGLPGDTIVVEPGFVTINGRRFANSATGARDSQGRTLTHVPWGIRHVNKGEVWLFGFNDARSWDSRYYGPLPLTALRWKATPVLTLGASPR